MPGVTGQPVPLVRYDRVEAMLLAGCTTREIQRTCATEFSISRRTVRGYIAHVRRKLAKAYEAVPASERRAQIDGMFSSAFRLALAERNPAAMVSAAQRLAELSGVARPLEINHRVTTADDVLAELTGEAGGVPPGPAGE